MTVKPKKSFGQHFLHDENIARKIAGSLTGYGEYTNLLEVGPGMGMLSKQLLKMPGMNWHGIEYDKESVDYFVEQFPHAASKIKHGDFLRYDLNSLFNNNKFGLIGNFPYNISTQIVFKALEYRKQIPEIVGMFQKEVAERLASKHGSKTYGILSVLCQTFYDVEILFQVSEKVFYPPPNVISAVVRMKAINNSMDIACEKKLFKIVKTAFNQRRKTLRNALKQIVAKDDMRSGLFDKRAEQLSVDDFQMLTEYIINLK